MKYYRLSESIEQKEIGVFPQRGEMAIGMNINDPKHLFNQQFFTPIDQTVFVPSFSLRGKAKLTDMISLSINSDLIISSRLKEIIKGLETSDFQFVPITLISKNCEVQYYLLRPTKSNFNCFDFNKTQVSIMETIWEEKEKIKVENKFELLKLIENTKLPLNIKIKRPYFLDECQLHIFSCSHVYHGYSVFVSEDLKNEFIKNRITGIRFRELDEN